MDIMSSLNATIAETQRMSEALSRSGQEKLARDKKLVEETENTRQLIEEFKTVVQEFINASADQTEAAKENNRIMKNWTIAIGLMTLVMLGFTVAVFFKS